MAYISVTFHLIVKFYVNKITWIVEIHFKMLHHWKIHMQKQMSEWVSKQMNELSKT